MHSRTASFRWSRFTAVWLTLQACGGLAVGEAPDPSHADGGSPSDSGSGGAPGEESGDSSSESIGGSMETGDDMQAGESDQTNGKILHYACYYWSQIENEPIPGASGFDACPKYRDLRLRLDLERNRCSWKALDEPVAPPNVIDPGDCCYGVTEFRCR